MNVASELLKPYDARVMRCYESLAVKHSAVLFAKSICRNRTTEVGLHIPALRSCQSLVRSLRLADDPRILLGEKGHSDSDFLLIFPDDRLQEGKKFFLLLGIVLRVVYVSTDLSNEFYVVHECPLPQRNIFL